MLQKRSLLHFFSEEGEEKSILGTQDKHQQLIFQVYLEVKIRHTCRTMFSWVLFLFYCIFLIPCFISTCKWGFGRLQFQLISLFGLCVHKMFLLGYFFFSISVCAKISDFTGPSIQILLNNLMILSRVSQFSPVAFGQFSRAINLYPNYWRESGWPENWIALEVPVGHHGGALSQDKV